MSYLIELNENITTKAGVLTSIEDFVIGMDIKRVFYIYGFGIELIKNTRGNHGHRNTTQCLVCLAGRCIVCVEGHSYTLESPRVMLVVPPNNILKISNCTKDCIILVLADTNYKDDIIYESEKTLS